MPCPRVTSNVRGQKSVKSFFFFLCTKGAYLAARGVLLDACHAAACQFKRRAPRRSVCARFLARTRGINECFELRMQRLDRRRIQLLKSKLWLWTRLLHPDAQGIAPGIVQRNVLMLLEKAHLPHALRGNPAGRDIGYRPSGKLEAR